MTTLRKLRHTLIPIITLLCTACIHEDIDDHDVVHVGDPVPRFVVTLTVPTAQNPEQTFSYDSSVRDGRGATIIFFSTTCSDCQRELPLLDARYRQGQYDGQHILCISREEAPGAVATFWRDHHLTLPVSPQTDRHIYHLFATIGVPRIYTVDPRGIITNIQYAE